MSGLFNRRKKEALPYCAAVVVAAGSSTRMEGQDKIMLPLCGEPVVARTLRTLECSPCIHEIVVVSREDLIVPVGELCAQLHLAKVSKIVAGGLTRAQSVLKGLEEVSARARLIAVQDGARPLLTQEVLSEAVQTAARCGAAAPAIPVKDTIKRAGNGIVEETPDRAQLFAVQTPQVFQADLIRAALSQAVAQELPVTDDCSAVERLGMKVTLTRGSEENIKITTPMDLLLAETILQWRETR